MTNEPKTLSNGERCLSLLSNATYVNAGLPPGEEAVSEGDSWCGKTQTTFGPDDQLCDGDACRDATRSCHEAI